MGLGSAVDFGPSYQASYIDVFGKSDPGSGPLTLAAWFKTDNDVDRLTAIHGAGQPSGDVAALAIVSGHAAAWLGDARSDPGANPLVSAESLADGRWHHMAMTFTGGDDDTLRLFVDGRLADVRRRSAAAVNIDGWSVGREYGAADYFGGSIDDVRLYDRALSDGGVSRIGDIAGGDIAGGDIAELYALAVPEPGTLWLLAAVAPALLGLSRRRRGGGV